MICPCLGYSSEVSMVHISDDELETLIVGLRGCHHFVPGWSQHLDSS